MKWRRVPQLYHLKSEVSITLRCQLCPTHYIAVQIKTCSKSTSATHAYKRRNGVARPSYINYHLKSEVFIMLRCWLCSICCTAVRIKNCSTSAIEITLSKIRTISVTKGSHHVLPPNQHFLLSAKMNGTQRRTLVSP